MNKISVLERLIDASHKNSFSYILTDSIPTGKSLAKLTCILCDTTWCTAIENIIRNDGKASSCPTCARTKRTAMLLERGKVQFDKILASENYSRLDDYKGISHKVTLVCPVGHTFKVSPTNYKSGQRCAICSGNPQNIPTVEAVNEYINETTWLQHSINKDCIELKCSACNTHKTLKRSSILSNRKGNLMSRQCNCQIYGEQLEDYISKLNDYELLTPYVASKCSITIKHLQCGHVWEVTPSNFTKPNYPTRCPVCSKSGRASTGQLAVAAFVRSLGFEVYENVTGLISSNPRMEADIFIPEKQLIIEFDGVWWHAEGPSRSHAGRSRAIAQPGATLTIASELAESGIRIVRIFSDEWAYQKEIVKSRLRAILGKTSTRMDARKLQLDYSVSTVETANFLNENHIQRNVFAKNTVAIGLRDSSGNLISIMTFGERSLGGRTANEQLELLRFCNKLNTTVRGAASRLLKAFFTYYEVSATELITFADIRWSNILDTFYTKIGFTFDTIIKPSYYYVHPSQSNKRVSRLMLQKHKILSMYPDMNADLTEKELTEALGYSRIWNSGQLRYKIIL